VAVLTDWHQKKVATLLHMQSVPDGTEVVIGEDAPMILTGDLLKGFILGVELALIELGKLPFEAENVTH